MYSRPPTRASKTIDSLKPFDDIWGSVATVSGRFGGLPGHVPELNTHDLIFYTRAATSEHRHEISFEVGFKAEHPPNSSGNRNRVDTSALGGWEGVNLAGRRPKTDEIGVEMP